MTTTDVLLKASSEYLSELLHEHLVAREITRAANGWSDEVNFIAAENGAGERVDFVARVSREQGAYGGLLSHAQHYKVLEALQSTDVPGPQVIAFEESSELFGAPFFLMGRSIGDAPIPWSPKGQSFLADARSGPQGTEFATVLADIHNVDWRELGLSNFLFDVQGQPHPLNEVATMGKTYAQVGNVYRSAIVEDALHWLTSDVPANLKLCLAHGDYRPANVLFTDVGVSTVLDWELAQVADPHYDLAWAMSPFNRSIPGTVADILDEHAFRAAYQSAGGVQIDEFTLRYFMVMVHVRQALIFASAVRGFLEEDMHDLRMLRAQAAIPKVEAVILENLRSARGHHVA